MQSKIINVNKCYWAAHIRKEKVDRGNDFNDCCLIPITYTCRVLVLDPTNFTALLYLCFSKPFTRPYCTAHHESASHTIATPEILIVPSFLQLCRPAVGDSWCCTACRQLHLYQLIIEIYLRGQQIERVD